MTMFGLPSLRRMSGSTWTHTRTVLERRAGMYCGICERTLKAEVSYAAPRLRANLNLIGAPVAAAVRATRLGVPGGSWLMAVDQCASARGPTGTPMANSLPEPPTVA